MSILIKGMEMPTSCGDCKAFVCYKQWAGDMGDCFCGITKEDAKAKEKNADCPLVPIPPLCRLIDADELFKGMERKGWFDNADRDIAEDLVLAAPTIIQEEEGET